MSKRAFNKIMQGIKEAGAYLDGTADKRRYRVHVPVEVNVKKSAAALAYPRRPLPRPTALHCPPCAS